MASLLAAVVLFMVATSLQVQYRAFNSGRVQVERAQLARVLLHRMADDVRGLIPPEAAIGGISPAATTSSQKTGDGTAPSGETGETGEKSADETSSDEDDGSLEAGSTPGLYGGLDWLRIDVVRAARQSGTSADSDATTAGSSASSPQSAQQIETIVYYVVPPDATLSAVSAASPENKGGLVRRQFPRIAAAFAADSGQLDYTDGSGTPIAAEVTAAEFRYYDGTDWLEDWDTAENGGLPMAVEMRIFIRSQTAGEQSASEDAGETAETQYRLVVPIALNASVSSASSEDAGESDSSGDGGDISAEGKK